MTAGDSHGCILSADGVARCWGYNAYGQLGDGTFTDRLTPVRVDVGVRFVQISAGRDRTCGVAVGGAAYCWGAAHFSLNVIGFPEPFRVPGGIEFTQLAVGYRQVCGLAPDGRPYCWNWIGPADEPQPVDTDLRFRELTGGGGHACGLTVDGTAYCWGGNSSGELGDGTTVSRALPVRVLGARSYVQLDASESTTCGVTEEGETLCWGLLPAATSTPMPVPRAPRFRSVAVGSFHRCGLDDLGAAHCLGHNYQGTLGFDGFGLFPNPLPVTGERSFSQLVAGGSFTCASASSGVVFCWGQNDYGQLGDGSRRYSIEPRRSRISR